MIEKFIIDTNSFIKPYRDFYAFDIVPTFWKEITKNTVSDRIILLDMVKKEIGKGKDELSEWLDNQICFETCQHVTQEIVGKWQEVLQYIQTCACYSEKALKVWSDENVADPWLIAAAAVQGYTIITFETKTGGLSEKYPSSSAKIPDVAEYFNVKVGDLYYMMRQLGMKI